MFKKFIKYLFTTIRRQDLKFKSDEKLNHRCIWMHLDDFEKHQLEKIWAKGEKGYLELNKSLKISNEYYNNRNKELEYENKTLKKELETMTHLYYMKLQLNTKIGE